MDSADIAELEAIRLKANRPNVRRILDEVIGRTNPIVHRQGHTDEQKASTHLESPKKETSEPTHIKQEVVKYTWTQTEDKVR